MPKIHGPELKKRIIWDPCEKLTRDFTEELFSSRLKIKRYRGKSKAKW